MDEIVSETSNRNLKRKYRKHRDHVNEIFSSKVWLKLYLWLFFSSFNSRVQRIQQRSMPMIGIDYY